MGRMSLLGWLRGGSDEVGWDDLVRRVVDAIAEQGRYGARGRMAFPAQVEVHLEVAGGGAAVARTFLADSAFDRAVGAELANRCDAAASDLPLRDYLVAEGSRTRVRVVEGAVRPWQVLIEGGDRDGAAIALAAAPEQIRFGRGEWHGGDRQTRNDLVVAIEVEFVSRRAGRLWRIGNRLEVEALDQGDDLQVRRRDGSTTRPARTASGRVPVASEEVVELGDGRADGRAVRLRFRRD
jgi:hypothetical protein